MKKQVVENKNDERQVPITVTKVYRKNQRAKSQTVVNKGGAGSAKSYSLCQYMLFERLLKIPGYRGLITRKTRHSLKLSTYKMFIEIMEEAGLYRKEYHNQSDMIIEWPETKGYILFSGLDKRERIKSTEWHDVWMEEGNEFIREDYTFLKTRLYRGRLPEGFKKPQIRISYNPVICWIQQTLEGKPETEVIKSTYKDNPFVNEEYKKTLEALKDEDLTYYKIYALGEDAEPEHLIYKPYTMIERLPEWETYDEIIFGMDFGYNKPTALILIGIKDEGLYLQELIYKTHLTNPDRISLMKQLIPECYRSKTFYADSEDPVAIKEIADAGFNVVPADKGKGSVKIGIDFCKRKVFYTVADNTNLNREREGYKWREDRDGNILDEPVKFRDHAMDAKRYAVYTHFVGMGESGTIKEALKDIEDSPDSETSKADWDKVR